MKMPPWFNLYGWKAAIRSAGLYYGLRNQIKRHPRARMLLVCELLVRSVLPWCIVALWLWSGWTAFGEVAVWVAWGFGLYKLVVDGREFGLRPVFVAALWSRHRALVKP